MAEQLTIGLPFNLDEGWMGGAYYLQNMLSALGTLPPEKQPRVVIITDDAKSYAFMQQSGYRHLVLTGQGRVLGDPRRCGINILFAYPLAGMEARTLSWIPDFQERHLPYLFTQAELDGRTAWHQQCLQTAGVLLSSRSAHHDLLTFYKAPGVPIFVVPFATFIPEERPARPILFQHHDLPERYFFLPNQFWIHKNHVVVLAALRELARRGVRAHVVLSGKEHDSRAAGYGAHLRELAEEWGIGDQLRFLGFIPRADQIAVMDHAIAVLQPSRFEGWSTVIEDAKALGQNVIASDLAVHREQLGPDAALFDPSDHVGLASLLEKAWRATPERRQGDYHQNQRRYGSSLLNTFAALSRANPLPLIEEDSPLEELGDDIAVQSGSAGERLLTLGWSGPEPTHVWSVGQMAELRLPRPQDGSRVRLACSGNPHVPGGVQHISLFLNGERASDAVSVSGGDVELTIDGDMPAWKNGNGNVLTLEVDQAATPPEHTGDLRLLGLCLWRIHIDRHRESPALSGAAA